MGNPHPHLHKPAPTAKGRVLVGMGAGFFKPTGHMFDFISHNMTSTTTMTNTTS